MIPEDQPSMPTPDPTQPLDPELDPDSEEFNPMHPTIMAAELAACIAYEREARLEADQVRRSSHGRKVLSSRHGPLRPSDRRCPHCERIKHKNSFYPRQSWCKLCFSKHFRVLREEKEDRREDLTRCRNRRKRKYL